MTMYGIDRLDTEKPVNVMIYNMGGLDTEVTIAQFSAIKDEKNKEYEHIEVLAEVYDAHLGGQDFDLVLTQILIQAFDDLPERQGKPSVIENAKALKRVQKESVKIKDVLSSNRAAEVKIGELVDGVTLKMTLPRSTFEEKSEQLLSRVEKPVLDALKQADMTLDDIDQVEVIGGGLRIPKVTELIKLAVNRDVLDVHLNGDEAMSFGASYIASNSSSSFKVRKVFLTQHPAFEYQIKISPLEQMSEEELSESEIAYVKDFTLFKQSDYLG